MKITYQEPLNKHKLQSLTCRKLRIRLVHGNGYYTVIGISITRNRISCNGINITIHQFGNNT